MLMLLCPICGNQYSASQSQLNHGRGKTCSYACGRARLGKPIQEKVKISCFTCGKNLLRPKKIAESASRNYCSLKCRSQRTIVNCMECGKVVDKPLSAKPVYCSRSCTNKSKERAKKISASVKAAWTDDSKRSRMHKAIIERSQTDEWKSAPHFQRGSAHPKYKGNDRKRKERYDVKIWRQSVFQRDGFKCQQCGAKRDLNAHHIKPWSEYPDLRLELSNGISLCETCHAKVHGLEPKHFVANCVVCKGSKKSKKSKMCRKCWLKPGRKD